MCALGSEVEWLVTWPDGTERGNSEVTGHESELEHRFENSAGLVTVVFPAQSGILFLTSVCPCGLPRWLSGRGSICQCRRHRFNLWVGKIPWRRKWQLSSVFLPGESHGQRSLVSYSPWGCKRIVHNLTIKQQRYVQVYPSIRDFFQVKTRRKYWSHSCFLSE